MCTDGGGAGSWLVFAIMTGINRVEVSGEKKGRLVGNGACLPARKLLQTS